MKEYSASLVSQSFWFIETKKVIGLIFDGMPKEDIKKKCIDDNYLGLPNHDRNLRAFSCITSRFECLSDKYIDLFVKSDLNTQKLINFIAIMKKDRLLFEFMYEVYREKIIIGVNNIERKDINVFFSRKDIESEKVAKISDVTKKRLGSNYFNFMEEANLINHKKEIQFPILNVELENLLKETGDVSILKALTGGEME